jgi:hypothetical protein
VSIVTIEEDTDDKDDQKEVFRLSEIYLLKYLDYLNANHLNC